MFSKILIANRGEIAVRIIRACKEMGISTVAVYSKADTESLHIALADEALCIGEAPASKSYLNQMGIISAALVTGAQAIYPGYGFLSENPSFAALCQKHGIVFIGPSSEVIAKMGNKDAARSLMKKAGVPVIPGSDIVPSLEEAKRVAEEIGYPILIKAVSGGGGKGIRLVKSANELDNAFSIASEEARIAFSDGSVYIEKYLSPVKHVEVQLLADEKGNVVCLGERECSIQKNNQKLIEEAPSPAVTPRVRRALMEAAIKAAKAVNYTSVGTVEFLLDRNNNFYFMEMNTRLQVEHGITEQITGIDIVKWQIRIAAGVLINFKQEEVKFEGSAIECRINAIGGGKVNFLHIPGGPWVRFDTMLYQGYELPTFYDAMIGKLIVYAKTREEAIRKMHSALCELVVDGIENNIDIQIDTINAKEFKEGNYYTDFHLKGSDSHAASRDI